MKILILGVVVVSACGESKRSAPAPVQAPATTMTGSAQAGVLAAPSLPRADWPCTTDFGGGSVPIEYRASLSSCRFPPDYWEPGCPIKQFRQQFDYDAQGRLVTYRELDVPTLENVQYDEQRVVARNEGERYVADDKAIRVMKGESVIRTIQVDGAGRPLRETHHDEDGAPSFETEWIYEGSRLGERVGWALIVGARKQVMRQTYGYDCAADANR